MAGRPSAVSYKQVFEALLNYKIFDDQGNIVVSKDDIIWSKAVADLNGAITIKNLHTRFYGNRNNLQKNLKKYVLSNGSKSSKSSQPVQNKKEEPSSPTTDTIEALDKLKAEVSFNPVITDISAKKFHVIYVTPDQVDSYKDFMKFYRKPIYFSVQNNLVENAFVYNRESEDIVLYSLFGEVDEMIIPFFQTLSERYNKEYVSYAIGEFLRKKVPVPHECVTECSLDLLEGICVAFNHQGLESYCESCFEFLIESKKLEEEKKSCTDEERKKEIEQHLHKIKSTLPVCILHIDINHIVQNLKILVDTCIDADKVALKDFYFDSLLYMCTLTDYEMFENFVKKLFITLYEKKYDKQVEEAKNAILQNVALMNCTDLKQNLFKQNPQIDSNQTVTDSLSFDFMNNRIYIHFKKIQLEIFKTFVQPTVQKKDSTSKTISPQEALSTNDDLEDNPYRHLNLLTEVTKFLTVFPVINRIINKCEVTFEYDYLKNKYLTTLNNVTLEKKGKISVGSFICKHIQNLFQQAEVCRSIFNTTKSQVNDNHSKNSKELVVYELLDYRENWMGKSGMGNSEVKQDDNCKQEDAEKEFEEELLYIKTMLDQSIVSNDHSYCVTDNSIEVSSIVQPTSSTPKSKMGIYTNPCPNLDLMYSKPSNTSSYKNPVILNGNTYNPRSKKNIKYKLESTSLFDVMVEIFIQAMGNYSNFYTFLNDAIKNDKKKESFLSLIHDHALQRDTKKFNTKRFHFLFKNGKVDGDRIFCDEEINDFFNKIMDDKYGLTVQQVCPHCYTIDHIKICCFSNIKLLKFLKSTETDGKVQSTELFQKNSVENCNNCKEKSIHIIESYDADNYLAISIKDCDIELCRLQETINVNNKKFILAGAVESIPTKIASLQNHYVAYCRFINGHWQVRDNKKSTASKANVGKKMKIIFVFYVHVE